MSEIVEYCAVASAVVIAGGIGYWFSVIRSRAAFHRTLAPTEQATDDVTPLSTAVSKQSLSESSVLGINLDFVDSTGNVVFNTRELPHFPSDAVILDDTQGVALARGRQLAADVFKGSLGLPNKTVEIVFDPDIQRKLAEGTLEVMPAIGGGTRAMARRVDNGQIAGHGRILEGGRVRQMAAGAFQLLSIAVAQSHLDDISRNLISIKNEIAGIREQLHINDKSRLTGTVDYLSRVVALIQKMASPDEIRSEKKVEMEAISREVSAWIEQIRLEVEAFNKRVANVGDQDTFGGTETTYKSLKQHADAARTILEKHNLVLRILALMRLCEAYIAPLETDSLPESWTSQPPATTADFERSMITLRDKANQLLSRALWNKQETLEQRRNNVISMTEQLLGTARQEFAGYDSLMDRINFNLKRLAQKDGKVRMAVSFDADSNVNSVALV
ncbi:hypothetical protein [Burkholderia glumae]|uniref:Uncharacterized protein n=1 Tax=Burkholderia glumae TaxID=337 RepID=A0ABY5BKZ1_BURGL|nr:hypothetical protein [Burkholderia glumae]MCM2480613.1 hypothetical protein [Burkholderia glumae]MCM2509248.1 hypothetical protein [Burkholderia glumae]USS47233.1 hypothetical protein NFI99_20435 [Burkholderia glumae]